MAFCESTVIARPDITQADVERVAEDCAKVIKDNKGKVVGTEFWGLRNLAYLVKKNKKGHYFMLNIDAPAEAVNELERQLRLNEDIIRNMTIRVDALSEEPSAVLQSANSNEG